MKYPKIEELGAAVGAQPAATVVAPAVGRGHGACLNQMPGVEQALHVQPGELRIVRSPHAGADRGDHDRPEIQLFGRHDGRDVQSGEGAGRPDGHRVSLFEVHIVVVLHEERREVRVHRGELCLQDAADGGGRRELLSDETAGFGIVLRVHRRRRSHTDLTDCLKAGFHAGRRSDLFVQMGLLFEVSRGLAQEVEQNAQNREKHEEDIRPPRPGRMIREEASQEEPPHAG